MLIEKTDVVAKLDALKTYSKSQDAKNASTFDSLFAPVYSAVNAYFAASNSGLSSSMNDVVQFMYFDIARRTTEYENKFNEALPTNFPVGYDDVTKCFYQFAELLNVSNATFFNAFVYGIPLTGGTEPIPQSNPYLTRWTTQINAAISEDLERVVALADWLNFAAGNSDMISLLEQRGKIVKFKTQREIANIIYNERHVLDVINKKHLSTYVPTYFKEA